MTPEEMEREIKAAKLALAKANRLVGAVSHGTAPYARITEHEVRKWVTIPISELEANEEHIPRINKLYALNNMPGWRNWQTHRT